MKQHTEYFVALVCCCMIISVMSSTAHAQEEQPRTSFMWDIAKSVALDPTTYAPTGLFYYSTRKDWVTSQVLFRAGWLEANPRYTRSGLPNDQPVSFAEGNTRIRNDALAYFAQSVFNNVGANVVERALIVRHPEHRKLIHTVSWIERIAVASYVSYLASANHFRQAERNRVMAREYGY